MEIYAQLQLVVTAILLILLDVSNAVSVQSTMLVLARDSSSAYSVTSGFNGYGIAYQLVVVPQSGITLPTLNASTTQGNYGGIVVLSELAYSYNGSWQSALTAAQWQQLYGYQTSFGVRMVRLDVYPGPDFGTTTQIAGAGCCNAGVEQYALISNNQAFPTAGLKQGATISTKGIWHYPATITNTSIATEIAQFQPSSDGTFTSTGTAAVINNIGGRQQMVWFMSWATNWAPASTLFQHAYIHWVTRGLYAGRRRVLLGTQIDDVQLATDLYLPAGTTYRIGTADIAAHIPWMNNINSRMNPGSKYFMELGHNGNGDIEAAVNNGVRCSPRTGIEYANQIDTPLEFMKPLGTGTNIWPNSPSSYQWDITCATGDSLTNWFTNTNNLNAFAHLSHTFTHEALDNATYSDTYKEMSFNLAWMKQVGISNAQRWSKGLIPPAITGMHNGDAMQAWHDNGVLYVVGDNTRPPLLSTQNEFYLLPSTLASNGFVGINIVPRWATTIYYNCNDLNCTTQEWINTSGGSGDYNTLLANAKQVNVWHLLALRQDPFMFHQANLRQADMPTFTVGSQTAQMSIFMIWVETIVQEFVRLVNWPIITIKHDDIGNAFSNRMAVDGCQPILSWTYNAATTAITGATLTTNGNTCSVPVPVTLAGGASTSGTATSEQIGNDPVTYWTTMNGQPVTFSLSSPVPV